MKYWAVYKCPLCGKLLKLADSIEIPYDELPGLLGQIMKNQLFAGNPYLHKAPLYIPCKCENGNAGLAQFAGFIQDTSNEDASAIKFLNNILSNLH